MLIINAPIVISYIHNFIAKLLIAIIFSGAFLWHFAVAAVGQIAAPILRRVYCRLTKQICELTKRAHTHAYVHAYIWYKAVCVLMCDYSPVCCCCCFIVQPLGSKNWFLIIIIVIIMVTIFGMLL